MTTPPFSNERIVSVLMLASIRPLHTTDLRIRRISGRHQISADGKHLIDGVAFGRPYLRRVDRPAVRIPPRKRRRITYNEDDEINEDEDVHDRQIVLRAGFNNADESMNSVESDEEDFSPDFENHENLDAELEDLYEDLRAGANDDEHTIAENGAQGTARTSRRKSRRSPKGLGLLRLLDEHGQPFVGEYDNPLLDKYDQAEPPPAHQLVGPSKRRSRSHAKGPVRSAKHGVQDSSASLERVSRRGSAGSNKSVHFEDAEPATPVTVRESQDSDEEDDDDFELDEVDESDKENAEPPIEEADSGDVCII